MSCTVFYSGDTLIHRLDPRPRIIATIVFTLLIAITAHSGVLLLGLVSGTILVTVARIAPAAILKRILRLNIFMAVLFILVPATFPGEPVFSIFSIPFSGEGLLWSLEVTVKANSIVLVFAALVGTIDPFVLAHAFHHMRVPGKLIQLLLFTIRYLDVFHHEYLSLLRAMKARAFRPSMRIHTYRSYAWLTGMLLVRSLERSERIMGAMKCRGFRGEFHVARHFTYGRTDLLFSIFSALLLAVIAAGIISGAGRLW